MKNQPSVEAQRDLLDRKLTELALLRQTACPAVKIAANTIRYEDEDARLKTFSPSGLSESEEEVLEEALVEKCIEVFDETGLFLACAAFDSNC